MAEGEGGNPGETPHEETESKPSNEAKENETSPGQNSPPASPKVEPEATSTKGLDCNAAGPDRQETPKESSPNNNDVALASQSAPAAEAVKTPDGPGNLEECILVALWFCNFPFFYLHVESAHASPATVQHRHV